MIKRRGRAVLWTAASVVLVPAAAGATWWLAGDLTTSTSPDPSYGYRAPRIDPATETVVGLVLTAIVLSYWLVFVLTTRRSKSTVAWLSVVASLTAAGVFIGYSGRMLTAGVDGANIGGGLVLLAGPFILGALLGYPIIRALNAIRAPTKSSEPQPPAGWYTDPEHPDRHRWWSGTSWAPPSPQPEQPSEPL